MIRNVSIPVVTDVAVAVVKELNAEKEWVWNTYLVNLKSIDLENVLVSSTGYGEIKNEHRKTSTLRHFIGSVPAQSFVKIEPIMEDLFGINNEYWVSFYINKEIFDKKFVFLAESICEKNFTQIPILKKKGVMIK
jgi:hypothetical protein